jgi:mannose-1-phosphate guanylyltransferase
LQAAHCRLEPLCDGRFIVVTGATHEEAVRQQLPTLAADNLLIEPSPRDSMAAIGLAFATLEKRDPDLIVGSFPADHVIPESRELHDCIRQGYAAAKTGLLALIGLEPTRPTSALGYIRMGREIGLDGAPRARRVETFIEKPSEERALRFIHSGDYAWNAGMWIARAGVLMDLLAAANPRLAEDLRAIAADPASMPAIWDSIQRTTIDHTIAEPLAGTTKICVVPGKFDWEDIGDFSALSAYLRRQDPSERFHYIGDKNSVVDLDSTGLVVAGASRTVAILGLDRIVVVDTDDALLVMSEEYAQDLKEVYGVVSELHPEVS